MAALKLITTFLLALALAACNEAPRTIRSPSGHYLLQVVNVRDRERVEEVLLIVEDAKTGARTLMPGEWAARFHISFKWDGQDRIWVDSSDIGTYAYQLVGGAWTQLGQEEQKRLPEPKWD
jgi:hypothetical protein